MFHPKDYQQATITSAINHFEKNDKGVIVMPCGSGKTITSLLIAKKMNVEKMIIFVPTLILIDQWIPIIRKIFPDKNVAMFKRAIKSFDILITTYKSAYNVRDENITFDMSILDECHHVNVAQEGLKTYSNALYINTKKQLGITATFKETVGLAKYYNDNLKYFGQIITRYSTKWAIEKKIICDYELQVLMFNREDNEIFHQVGKFVSDNCLYIAALTALKNIQKGDSKHILIYANKIAHCTKIIEYIKLFIEEKYFDISGLKYFAYTSKQKSDLSVFTNAEYGIISSVYSLGEGYDLPILDTVIFSENMSSEIRIIQSALRPCRLYPSKEKAKIIIPLLCNKNKATSNEFKKVRQVIKSMIDEDAEFVKTKINIGSYSGSTDKISRAQDMDLTMYNREGIDTIISNVVMDRNEFGSILNSEPNSNNFATSNNFAFGKVLSYRIGNSEPTTGDNIIWRQVLIAIYNTIDDSDGHIIMENTTFGKGVIGRGRHRDPKVPYLENKDLFLRGVNANRAMNEIIAFSKKINLRFAIVVQLRSGEIVDYSSS